MVSTSHELGDTKSDKKVTVIIPTKDKFNLVKNAIFSVRKNAGIEFELVVVDGGKDETWDWLVEQKIFAIKAEENWTFSDINNEAAQFVDTPYILLLNNDIVAKPNFLAEMVALIESNEKIGIVGAKLLFPDNTIQHIGVFFTKYGRPYHTYYKAKDSPDIWLANRDDEFDTVTGACLLIRKSVWDEVGGMDNQFCFNYEDVDLCLRVRELGYKIMIAHKAVLIHFEGMSFDSRKPERFSVYANFELFKNKWLTSKRIDSVIGKKIETECGPLKTENLNILFVPAAMTCGISYWRMLLPAWKLSKKKLANVEIVQPGVPTDKMMNMFRLADIAVYQAFFTQTVFDIAQMQNARAFKMVYELDDHPVYLSPFAQVYRTLGTQEIKYEKDGEYIWLWRDGENGFYIEENINNKTKQLMIISLVDHVTTTTEALKDYFLTKNKNVTAIPNCIDFDVFKPLPLQKDDYVRIGWHGGDNHFHDIDEIGSQLTEFVNKNDNVKLVIMGGFYKGPFKGINMDKVELYDWVHIEAFPYKLAGLNVDFSVIPLADEKKYPFNKYKSDLKFCEYSSLQVPSLIQADRTAYRDCVDGENCLTFSTDVEFKDKLERLTRDTTFRRDLGKKAYDWCYAYRNLDKEIYRWLEVYKEIAKVKNDVNSIDDIPSRTAPAELLGIKDGSGEGDRCAGRQ